MRGALGLPLVVEWGNEFEFATDDTADLENADREDFEVANFFKL